jgi:hypothetical protein
MQHAQNIAEAYCGFPVKLKSPDLMRVLLTQTENVFAYAKTQGMTVKRELTEKGKVSLGKDTVTALRNVWEPVDFDEELTPDSVEKRLVDGAHPLLEAMSLREGNRILMSNYIKPLLIPLEEDEAGNLYHSVESMHVGEGAPRVW